MSSNPTTETSPGDVQPAFGTSGRGLTRAQAEEAQAALEAFGQAAMLLETHLPQRGARPVPGAARFADALAADTERAARQVRERHRPRWDRASLERDTEAARQQHTP